MNLKNGLSTLFLCSYIILATHAKAEDYYQNTDLNLEPIAGALEVPVFTSKDDVWNTPFRIYADHTEGNWLDNNQGYTSIGCFSALPFLCDYKSYTTFTDIRGHFFNNGRFAANAGFGLRYKPEGCTGIFGMNTYYDYREGSWDHDFHQLGLGFEYLSPTLDIRLNTYLPICSSIGNSSTTTFSYPGGYLASVRDQRVSYGGADLEVGTWITRNTSCDLFELYGAIGTYYYASRYHMPNDYGATARLQAYFLNYFTFEFKGGFDEAYHGMAQGTLSVAIPLDILFNSNNTCSKTCKDDTSLFQAVNRQEIIALSRKQCYWKWNWDSPTVPCCD
jgi:hypothetical protein